MIKHPTAGSPERTAPPRRPDRPAEHAAERRMLPPARHHESRTWLEGPVPLFFASPDDAIPEQETSADDVPAPDWQTLHDSLIEHITRHAGTACAFTVLLPQAGEVDVTLARGQPSGWEISLRFPPQVWRQWQQREILCRRQLSRSLSQPVRLRMERGSV